jgi:hypothetical protein
MKSPQTLKPLSGMMMILQWYNKVIVVVQNMKHCTARNINVQWESGGSYHKLIISHTHC